MKRFLSLAMLVTASLAFASGPGGGGTGGGGGTTTCGCVELAASKKIAPPGSLSQMSFVLTEPKPISTGGGSTTLTSFDTLAGISLASHSQDAWGVAVVNGNSMNLSVVSPSATWGNTIDYPVLNVVGHVPSTVPMGTTVPFGLAPNSMQYYDASGNPYPTLVKDGSITAGTSVAIGDVIPGSATLPAGAIVRILGTNFFPNTQIRFAEANIQKQFYVSANEIDVVLAVPATMEGMTVQAKNPDNTTDTYYSYQRTYPTLPLSSDPVLALSMPLQPATSVTTATVTFTDPTAVNGLALSNIGFFGANALLTLLDASGNVIAFSNLSVAPSHFAVRSLGELFPGASGTTVQVISLVPVEVLGIAANEAARTAMPVIAH